MVLPALQVRVPNPANALLQAEQIKGARAQTQERQRQGEVRNALLSAFQGGIPTDPAGQNALVNQIAGVDPQTALGLMAQFREANAPAPGFTLSPGGTRFDAAGNVVASRPAAPAAGFTLAPGSTRFDAAGNPVASTPAASGFTLVPGATRFDAAGNPIATTPTTPSQFDQRVSELRSRGFSDQESQDIAAGRIRVSTDPVTGNTSLVNVATGEGEPVRPQEGPVLTSDERGRLFNQNASIERVLGLSQGLEESAASASGPRGSLGALVNSLAGLAGRDAPIPAPEIARARQDIRLFNQIAKTAIVNNPRFPVAEQQIVEQMLPNPSAFFANPSVEFNKVLQLQEFLRALQQENNSSLGVAADTAELTAEEQAELERLRSSQDGR